VPVSSTSPNTTFGTSFFGVINDTTASIFNFDIPYSYAGLQCSVLFLFPNQTELVTSSYTFSGNGSIAFEQLSTYATIDTTFDTTPNASSTLNTIAVQPGNDYVVSSGACAAGTTQSIALASLGGLSLEFFQDE